MHTLSDKLLTRNEQAYQTMRQMIATGQMVPGKWLKKLDLAEEMDMSPTPVVEALRRLQHEGLVEVEARVGVRVRSFNTGEVRELYIMREMLECAVARECALKFEPYQVMRFRQMAVQLDELNQKWVDPDLAETFSRGSLSEEEVAFHLGLAQEAGLSLFAREIERLAMLKTTCRLVLLPAPTTNVSHEAIMDAIATGDAEKAEEAMRRHVREIREKVVPLLLERFGDGPIIWDGQENK